MGVGQHARRADILEAFFLYLQDQPKSVFAKCLVWTQNEVRRRARPRVGTLAAAECTARSAQLNLQLASRGFNHNAQPKKYVRAIPSVAAALAVVKARHTALDLNAVTVG